MEELKNKPEQFYENKVNGLIIQSRTRWGLVESEECGKNGVRSVENGGCAANEECGKHGVWKMRSVENTECGKCRVWKMRGVENESVENVGCGK